jgi:hypothetical protein
MVALLESSLLQNIILPFLLVFVIVFAILQKSKILGGDKGAMDAIIALVIALIFIGFPGPRDIVVSLLPWMVVALSIILVFFILYGFVAGDMKEWHIWVKIVFGILIGIFVIGLVLWATGSWATVKDFFSGDIWNTVIVLLIIAGAMVLAIATSKKRGG